jgi:hypothetical protein
MIPKYILALLLAKRRETAVDVQKVLTEYGCMIKTRLGIHDGVLDKCSDTGLIMLELVGEKKEMLEFQKKLEQIEDVSTQLIELALKKKK